MRERHRKDRARRAVVGIPRSPKRGLLPTGCTERNLSGVYLSGTESGATGKVAPCSLPVLEDIVDRACSGVIPLEAGEVHDSRCDVHDDLLTGHTQACRAVLPSPQPSALPLNMFWRIIRWGANCFGRVRIATSHFARFTFTNSGWYLRPKAESTPAGSRSSTRTRRLRVGDVTRVHRARREIESGDGNASGSGTHASWGARGGMAGGPNAGRKSPIAR